MEQNVTAGVSRRAFVGVAGATLGLGALCLGGTAFAAGAGETAGSGQATGGAADRASTTSSPAAFDLADLASSGLYVNPSVSDLREQAADPKRVLVVVDYQVDFVSGGVFGEIEPAKALEDAIYERVKEYQDAGDIVMYTMDTHPADVFDYTREGGVNPLHCDPATEGWQVYGKVRELLTPEKALLVKKGTYGSMDLPFVIENIRRQGVLIESIEMAGVSTTCRVLHNAIILYNAFPELPIVFDIATTASYSDEQTVEQLKELETWGFAIDWRDYDFEN